MSIRKGDTMIAGSDRMWKGTAAELAAALAAHEIPEGKQVMVTDDYDNAYHPRPNWSAAVDISDAIGTAAGYVCPSDGFIVISGHASVQSVSICIITINDSFVAGASMWETGWYTFFSVNQPVNKGDKINCYRDNTGTPFSVPQTVYKETATAKRFNYKFVPWKD